MRKALKIVCINLYYTVEYDTRSHKNIEPMHKIRIKNMFLNKKRKF